MLSRVGLVLVLWLTLAGAAHAVVIPVTRTDDRVGGSCTPSDCTLREAIASAQAGDTVQLAAGEVHTLTQGAQLTVDQAITIAGAAGSRVDGSANTDALFRVNRIMRVNATVTIRDLTFSGGRDGNDENFQSCSPCDTITANGGGAIFNTGSLTLTRVGFEGNQNSPTGGAVGNTGSLTLNDVEFHANAAAFGAALFSRGGTVTANGVTMHANEGTSRGAVYVLGGTMLLENTTVTGNGRSNTIGGGVVNGGGALTLRNVTIADNLRGGLLRTAGSTTVANSILASGCAPAGQFGALTAVSTDLGHNLDEDNSCALTAATTATGQARLAPVNANGGATPTLALLTGSPALDAIPAQDCPPADQRGVQRVGPCDIGAFEAERLGQPTAVTEDAGDITDAGALLAATVGSADEGGKLSFEWGMAPEALAFRTPGVGFRAAAAVLRDEAAFGFPAGTRIYYRAVAENASGLARGAVKSFTTKLAPPTIQSLETVDVGDETVTLRFTVDPGGAGGRYRIRINDDEPPLTPLPGTGPREITRTIPYLAPNTNYRFQVEVSNDDHTTASDDGIVDRRTLRRFSGTAGAALTVGQDCSDDGRIAWGDGSTSPLVCAGDAFSATHTYAAAGRHRVKLTFEDGGTGELVTQLEAGAGKRLLSVNVAGKGRVTGNGIDCPGVCSVELPADAAVALTATPGGGEQFHSWSGFCGANPACTFELGSDVNIAADFSGTLQPPGLGELNVSDITATSARVGFLVDANGVSTSYRLVVNGTELAPVAVGAGSGPAPVAHTLSGLAPSTRYDVQVIATNGAGDVSDATVFTTAERGAEPDPTVTPTPTAIATAVPTASPGPTPTVTPTPVPEPTAAVDVVGAPAGGTVLVKLPRTNRFVALTAGQELPYGTEVDARKGRVKLTSIPKAGAPPETAEFYDGRFRISYVRGITNLTLSEPLAPCRKARGASAAAQNKKAKSRKLWGKGKGSFRTTGKYSAATVRGTTWLVQDTCAGTLTRVTQGAVTVRHGRKNVVVRAGKRYLAKAKR